MLPRALLLCFGCVASATLLQEAHGAGASVPVDDLVELLRSVPVQVVPDLSEFGEASQLIENVGLFPAPTPAYATNSYLSPKRAADIAGACDRDFSRLCPAGFYFVGHIHGDSTPYCAAGVEYQGPCESDAFAFDRMSDRAKLRWSNMCQAFWPCVHCTRNYTVPCPVGWARTGDSGLVCSPAADYDGPCDDPVDFSGYSRAMLEHWSGRCRAFWQCERLAGVSSSFVGFETQPVEGQLEIMMSSGEAGGGNPPALRVARTQIGGVHAADHLDALRAEISDLLPRVQAGGRMAQNALSRLLAISSEPDAKTVMRVAGVEATAANLMKSPSSSSALQRLAGSVVTVMTGLPVTSQIADSNSGSSGSVNIVLPRPSRVYHADETYAEISAGLQP